MAFSYARRSGAGDRKTQRRGGFLRLLVSVLLIAWVIRSFVFAPFSIPSASMLPSLFIGDYVLVAKWPYGYSRYSFPWGIPPIPGRMFAHLPKRGDVVVFRAPGTEEDYVKRVLGLPGDEIAVQDGAVLINGKPVQRSSDGATPIPISANSPCRVVAGATPMVGRTGTGAPACIYPVYTETLPDGRSYKAIDQVDNRRADHFAPVTVPAGHVFLMGDNRDDSLDSRFSVTDGGIGFVPVENLIGRAAFIFWSTDGTAEYAKPWTWFSALRGDRIGTGFGGGAK